MRLSSISSSTLQEAFSRTDFFDLYTLLYASKDERYRSDHNIQRLTRFYVDYIWNDLIIQLTNICTLRFQDSGPQFGVPDVNDGDYNGAEEERKIRAIPLSIKLKFLDHIVTNQISGKYFAGETWRGLCAEVLRASKAISHQQKVIAVDRLMNLLHHGGQITDYLDGGRWLPEVLNYRDNASFLQLARHASGEVKKAIGTSSFIGADRADVPILKMLETAIRRGNSSQPMTLGRPWATMVTSVADNKIYIRLSGDENTMLVGTHINNRIFFKDQDGLAATLFSRHFLHPLNGGDSDPVIRSSIKLPITNYHSLVTDMQLWLLKNKSRAHQQPTSV